MHAADISGFSKRCECDLPCIRATRSAGLSPTTSNRNWQIDTNTGAFKRTDISLLLTQSNKFVFDDAPVICCRHHEVPCILDDIVACTFYCGG